MRINFWDTLMKETLTPVLSGIREKTMKVTLLSSVVELSTQ